MEEALKDIKFKYTFRDYQKEALDMLDRYKNDSKIHVVAAPGAGKTILALELLIRIGRKALILAPTIAIKEQWIERLKKDFLGGDKEELISTELENPSVITVITYQSLYSLNRKKVDIESIIKENNIRTIVLDEAHHLRKVWFKTLKKMLENLKDCTTVALTATPPYDNGNDFANYMSLCGDIDAKITIPQLVKSDCLCPHQDYIYFNFPTEEQENKLERYHENIEKFIYNLYKNVNFIKAIALNDYIINASENVEGILDEFDFYIAILSFLNKVNVKYPVNEFNKEIEVPEFSKELLEILLERYIFGKNIEEKEIYKETFKSIKEELNILGSIDEKKINLKYTKELSDMLLKNSGKLESINKIIEIEKETLKEKLKLVIVTDFIKDEYYDVLDENDINVIGVMPIFRKVLASNLNVKIAMLTGTCIIIPSDLKDVLYKIALDEYGIENSGISVEEIGIDFNYSKVVFEEKYKRYSVNIITKLFEKSDISVLVGTVALIGEGWDAPFINSLIMASFVSSYVTSNQVRGRAIRINKKDKLKVSNIWHLICLEKDKDKYVLGQDYDMLSRRFLAYDGLNLNTQKIDSGIERLNITNRKYLKEEIEFLNQEMMINASNREYIRTSWDNALKGYRPVCRENIPIERFYKNKSGKFIRNRKMGLGLLEATLASGIWLGGITFVRPIEALMLIIINRYIFDGKQNSEYIFIKKACNAVYKTMINKENLQKKTIYYVTKNNGTIEFGLKNADTYEQLQFIKNVKQCMSLDFNSRYIIKSGKHIYVVPEMFSKNAKDAKLFMKYLLKTRTTSNLIYTKSEKGKKLLLRYKMKEFMKKYC